MQTGALYTFLVIYDLDFNAATAKNVELQRPPQTSGDY